MDINFISSGYVGRSTYVDSETMVNFYPEVDAAGKTVALVGTPGTVVFTTVGGSTVRGMHAFAGLLFVVSSNGFYSITTSGSIIFLGTLTTSAGIVGMEDNSQSPAGGDQIFIADGSPFGYVYNVKTGIFSVINSTNGTGCQITTVSVGGILTGTQKVLAAGSGYSVGNILNVAGGVGGQVQVATLSGTGVASVTVFAGGSGYANSVTYSTSPLNPGYPITGASDVCFLDGYFVVAVAGSSATFQNSNLYDGTSWNALNVAAISAFPQPLSAVFNFNRDLWLFGPKGTEIWFDAGSGFPPFQRYSPGAINHGTISTNSIAQSPEKLFWLAQSNTGGVYVMSAQGGGGSASLRRISTVPIEYQMSKYSTYSLQNSFAYVYQQESHVFYVLTFPADIAGGSPVNGATWVFDDSCNMWHQRSSVYIAQSRNVPFTINRHIGNNYAFFNGKHYVGDLLSGEIYELNSSAATDNGDPIVRIRTGQVQKQENNNIIYSKFQLDMEVAKGDGTTNPVVNLEWSNDSGNTWGNKLQRNIGAVGEYGNRIIWRQLGMGRNRVFRVTISDPIIPVITKAYVDATVCAN